MLKELGSFGFILDKHQPDTSRYAEVRKIKEHYLLSEWAAFFEIENLALELLDHLNDAEHHYDAARILLNRDLGNKGQENLLVKIVEDGQLSPKEKLDLIVKLREIEEALLVQPAKNSPSPLG